MAFNFNNFSRHGGSTTAPSWWTYHTNDAWDDILPDNYFGEAFGSLNVNDFILVRSIANTFMLRVTAVAQDTVAIVRDTMTAPNIGSAIFTASVTQTATDPDTAYQVPWDLAVENGSIKRNVSDNTKIEFTEAGTYLVQGNLQLKSSSASAKTFYFFPTINGESDSKSVRSGLKDNNVLGTLGVSAALELNAGDYIQANWAVSDTAGWLDASAATSFAPSSYAAQISIIRV